MISKPIHPEFTITNDQIFEIRVLVEKQGGNKKCAWRINQIFTEIEKEHEKRLKWKKQYMKMMLNTEKTLN